MHPETQAMALLFTKTQFSSASCFVTKKTGELENWTADFIRVMMLVTGHPIPMR